MFGEVVSGFVAGGIVDVDGVLMDVEGVVFPVTKSSKLKGLLVNQLENMF